MSEYKDTHAGAQSGSLHQEKIEPDGRRRSSVVTDFNRDKNLDAKYACLVLGTKFPN